MADTKLSALDAITVPTSSDLAYVVQSSTSKQASLSNFSKGIIVTNLDVTGLTSSELIRLNSGGTALESSGKTVPTGDIVGLSDTQTLTNKTLTTPIITSISNSGTITVPTGTDTLVGRATTDTLTNKTLTSAVLTTPQINDTSADHQYVFAVSELTADRTVTLPLLTGNDTFVFNDHIQTLTNKRITKRITTITSNAAPTVNTDNADAVTITALALAITSMTTNLSGTPTNFQTLIYRILDDGTARAITWGATFQDMGVALPTTTRISKVLTVGFIYDTVDSKWGCVAVSDDT